LRGEGDGGDGGGVEMGRVPWEVGWWWREGRSRSEGMVGWG
jgi:hypothetical protein